MTSDFSFNWNNILNVLKTFSINDFVDIVIVAFLVYKVLNFASNNRAGRLLKGIFFHNAPLHDGATIIRGGRIYAAGCFLPLSENYDISNMLGTRHRAALGMSENSDAVVVVVSEETGIISMAVNGQLNRELDPVTLKRKLEELLINEKPEKSDKNKDEKPDSQNAEEGGKVNE